MDKSEEIQRKKDELIKLQAEQAAFDAMPDDQKLAEAIHDKLCHLNHTDVCGYTYSTWSQPGSVKLDYLKKSRSILNLVKIDVALKIVNCL